MTRIQIIAADIEENIVGNLDQPVQTVVSLRHIVRDRRSIQSQNADTVRTLGVEVEIETQRVTKEAEAIREIEKSVVIVLVHVGHILPIVAKEK